MSLSKEIDQILSPFMGGLNAKACREKILAATQRHIEVVLLSNNTTCAIAHPEIVENTANGEGGFLCVLCHRQPVAKDGDLCAMCGVV